jgi:hypothetical protein
VGGSFIRGARVSLDSVRSWSKTNKKRVKEIIVVDIYGEYSRVLAMEKATNK